MTFPQSLDIKTEKKNIASLIVISMREKHENYT